VCPGGEHLDEPGLLVVDLVAVSVHPQVVPGGEVDGDLHRPHAVLTGVLVVGDGPHDVDAQAHRLVQQLFAVREGDDPLLRKGDELEGHHVLDPLAHLDERAQRGQARVGDVDVAADVQHAVGDLPPQHLEHPAHHVVVREHRLALGPAGDPLPERPALVPPRLAGRQDSVEVDVRLDVRRCQQHPGRVELLRLLIPEFDLGRGARGRDRDDASVLADVDVDRLRTAGQPAGPNDERHQASAATADRARDRADTA
jgi:hypothetical protein